MLTKWVAPLVAAGFLLTGIAVSAACGDDGDTDDETAPGATVTVEPEAEPDPEADPDPEAEPDPEAPVDGVVTAKSDDATQVDVTLGEWEVAPAVASIGAGKVYFLVTNEGPEDAHEFVIARTSRALDELPIVDGKVDETLVNVLDEIEPFTVGTSASIELELEAGDYVLFCNIAEVEEGELESHVELGMKTSFTVE